MLTQADQSLIRQQLVHTPYNHSLFYYDLDGLHNQIKNNKTDLTNQTAQA